MIRPDVVELTERTYAALGGGLTHGDDEDWLLLSLIDGVTRQHTSVAVAADTPEGPGWSALLDVDRAPSYALGYLGQFRGVTLDGNLDDASQRLRILETAGSKRGSPGAILGAARQYLTGNRNVILEERTPTAYSYRVSTYLGETPDPAAVEAALVAQKPAGLLLDYVVIEGVTIDDLLGTIDAQVLTIDQYALLLP